MNSHPRSLVDGHDIVVLVKHIERNRFGFGTDRRPRLGTHGDEHPTAKFLGRFRGFAIDQDKTAVDEFLHARARKFRAMGGYEPVEPGTGVCKSGQKFMNLGLGSSRHEPIVAGCAEA